MNLDDYFDKLYDYNEPIKEKKMGRVCRAVFTIIDDEDLKLNRTEVVEITYPITENDNMFDAMIDYLSEDLKTEAADNEESKIILGH